MALEYLKVFGEIEEYVEELTDDQLGRVFSAMMAYAFRDEEPDFERGTAERYVWPAIRNKIDGCERKVRQKRANGEKGGRPSKNENKDKPEETENNKTEPEETKENQTEPNETSNVHEHEHEQEHEHEHVQEQEQRENESARARKRAAPFTPPSPDEVAAYCRERGNTVDAERFCDFYASKGWMIGNQRKKDWRAAVRTWEKRGETQAAQRDSPGGKEQMLRYTSEERKKTYSAAILDFDAEEKQ